MVPSMLRRFRTISAEERAEKTLKLEEAEAERDIVEAIRAEVAAAAKVGVRNTKEEAKHSPKDKL